MATISNIQNVNLNNVSATLDGVNFELIPESTRVVPLTQPAGRNGNLWNTNNTGEWLPAVNAVDIDWNGAQVQLSGDNSARTINTTGDLISAIIDASGSSTVTLSSLMGSSLKGSATQPIYWDGSEFKSTTHSLSTSVPANAVFTDTTYSAGEGLSLNNGTFELKTANSNTLGGIKLGHDESLYSGTYQIKLDQEGKAYVEVPWEDTTIDAAVDENNKTLTVTDKYF